MPNISSSELIAQFQTALRDGWGYIYGASGEVWTQAQQNAASREQTKKYGQKWVGHRVADCSGLFAWAFRQLGGYCYHGSNTMFRRYSSASGSLAAGKRTDGEPLKPGTAVYKFNASEGYHHVGLYIGEGGVIEAKGTAYGVATSKIGSGWTHWGELKGVDYAEKGEQIAMSETKLAVVTTASGSLNMRKTASKSAEVIAKIPQGATITVLMETDDWWRVQYKNSTGWCAAEFLTKQENVDNQARMSIQIVDSAGNVFEPVGDFTVKVANADLGDS